MSREDTNKKLGTVMSQADRLPHLKALGKRNSKRAKQRAIALYLAHSNDEDPGYVSKYSLEKALRRHQVFNKANFTQNMKKDSNLNAARDLWTIEQSWRRGPSGWRLTEKGARIGAEVFAVVNATYLSIVETIKRTIKLTVSRVCCIYCADEVVETEDACKCDKCGAGAHYSCWDEMKSRWAGSSCFNVKVNCKGHVKVLTKPEDHETHTVAECRACNGRGWVRQTRDADGNRIPYGRRVNMDCSTCGGSGDLNDRTPAPAPAPAPVVAEPAPAPVRTASGGLVIRIRPVTTDAVTTEGE